MTSTAESHGDAKTSTVMQAYRFALDPTPERRRALASHCGAARVAYNWGLDLVTTRLAQPQAGEDVEVPWTLPELRRERIGVLKTHESTRKLARRLNRAPPATSPSLCSTSPGVAGRPKLLVEPTVRPSLLGGWR
jgi:Helix-turn-helix domain